jgi:RNA recognition motif-containing protein
MKLFVGNLAFNVTDDDLRRVFEPFGEITGASIVKERMSGESRGFGFVEMPSKKEAEEAIIKLNGSDMNGRGMTVNEARPMPERDRSGPSRFRGQDSRRQSGSRKKSMTKNRRKSKFGNRMY